jgi:hypothetical protein
MRFDIGDIVHLDGTNEEGRIVRLFTVRSRVGYIVTTDSFGKQIEALWFPRELKEVKERARRNSYKESHIERLQQQKFSTNV